MEEHDILLNDGATKLFLSTKGTQNDISKPLQAFLDYIDGQDATDELLKDIDEAVYEVKHCEAWKEEYKMLSMDRYTYWKEGVAEGIEQGMAQGLEKGIEQGVAEGTAKAKAEVVVQMLQEKLPLEMIARFTKLSLEEITAIGISHGLL